MNIALFASAFHPHGGGVEELSRQLAHAFRRAGHECIIVTNRWPRSLAKHERFEGIDVYRPAMRVPEGSLKAHLSYHLTHGAIRHQVIEILRRHEVDVLHVQCVSSNALYALHAAKALRLPLIVSSQGERTMDAGRLYQRSRYMNRLMRSVLDEADFVTACSQDTLAELTRWYGPSLREKSSVIYNGICISDFENSEPFAHRRRYVLAMGRLVPQKGFDLLLAAWGKISAQDIDLIIAGEGPQRPDLEELSHRLHLNERVSFFGRADRRAAAKLFRGCEFFVLPSRIEPLGIVNLEAMAAAKAVIATRTGGVSEIVHDGQNGLLVQPEDVAALAGAIDRLATQPDKCRKMGQAGRQSVVTFDWEVIAKRYLSLYERHVEGRIDMGAVEMCEHVSSTHLSLEGVENWAR